MKEISAKTNLVPIDECKTHEITFTVYTADGDIALKTNKSVLTLGRYFKTNSIVIPQKEEFNTVSRLNTLILLFWDTSRQCVIMVVLDTWSCIGTALYDQDNNLIEASLQSEDNTKRRLMMADVTATCLNVRLGGLEEVTYTFASSISKNFKV